MPKRISEFDNEDAASNPTKSMMAVPFDLIGLDYFGLLDDGVIVLVAQVLRLKKCLSRNRADGRGLPCHKLLT